MIIDVKLLFDAYEAYEKDDLRTLLRKLYYATRRSGSISCEGEDLGLFECNKSSELALKTNIGTVTARKRWSLGWDIPFIKKRPYMEFQLRSGKLYAGKEAIKMYFKFCRG